MKVTSKMFQFSFSHMKQLSDTLHMAQVRKHTEAGLYYSGRALV